MKIFIGLDLSLVGTGCVVVGESGEGILGERFGLSLKKDASDRDKIERLTHIAGRIVKSVKGVVADGHEIGGIGIENYAFSARGAQNDLGEIHGVVKTQMWMVFGVVPVVVPASKARKKVLGKGRFSKGKAGKSEIVSAVNAMGFKTRDDNIADAYVIAEYLRRS